MATPTRIISRPSRFLPRRHSQRAPCRLGIAAMDRALRMRKVIWRKARYHQGEGH